MKSNHQIITIDGPGGSGKGTLCRLLAQQLGWHMLDSGALYRLLALTATQQEIKSTDSLALAALAKKLSIHFDLTSNGNLKISSNDKDVTLALQTERNGQLASQIATLPAVRAALLEKQRLFSQAPGLVTDGRDMGTIVFPQANLKIFLLASAEARAQRRYKQLKRQGVNVILAQILDELKIRDERDSSRALAPLRPALDSIVVDASQLTIQLVLDQAMALARERGLLKSSVL